MPQSPLTGGIASPMPGGPGGPGEEDDGVVRDDEGEGGNPCASHAGPDEECYPTPEGDCECFEVVDVVDDGGTDSKHPSLPIDWFLANEVPDLDAAFLDDFLRGLREVGGWISDWWAPDEPDNYCPTFAEYAAEHGIHKALGAQMSCMAIAAPSSIKDNAGPLSAEPQDIWDRFDAIGDTYHRVTGCLAGYGEDWAEIMRKRGEGNCQPRPPGPAQ